MASLQDILHEIIDHAACHAVKYEHIDIKLLYDDIAHRQVVSCRCGEQWVIKDIDIPKDTYNYISMVNFKFFIENINEEKFQKELRDRKFKDDLQRKCLHRKENNIDGDTSISQIDF